MKQHTRNTSTIKKDKMKAILPDIHTSSTCNKRVPVIRQWWFVTMLRIRVALEQLVIKTYYRMKCVYWNKRIPKDINLYLQRWKAIDHRQDKSVSGEDFRLWYYLRKVQE